MDSTYWYKQTAEAPLYPDMLWNRPENRRHAGKLLIIGGNAHGFSSPAGAYSQSLKAGVGSVRVLLPDSLSRTLGKLFPDAEFAPSTPSGSFAQKALAEFLDASRWADGLLLAGDLGKNSETAIVIEKLLEKYQLQLTLVGDAVDYALQLPSILTREQTLVVVDFAQARKLIQLSKSTSALTTDLGPAQIVPLLHDLTLRTALQVVLVHQQTMYVAFQGNVSTTPTTLSVDQTAARNCVWWLQNPEKPFEALTSSIVNS